MNAIETIKCTWEKFVDENYTSSIDDKKFMYRGQTNGKNPKTSNFMEWPLVSSYNRSNSDYEFNKFIYQQVEFISTRYYGYDIIKKRKIDEEEILAQIYFLQHYGIPTCFIDFTYHPLIALYFAVTGLEMRSGGYFNPEGFFNEYSNEYFTIYKIDIQGLVNTLNIKTINKSNSIDSFNYDDYRIDIDVDNFGYIAVDTDPLSKIKNPESNYNLKHQHSCFLMYDNSKIQNHLAGIGFEEFLTKHIEAMSIRVKEPIIYKYQIGYNGAYKPRHDKRFTYEPLFTFLREEKVIGYDLFDDIQGLRYDFKFFHQEY
ncbi:MAG TPA: FRG domain-containing protein [Prolixibacteraceae bacterium]|nr:FRG domain-containing protein [Prolixibacteraceae bacterium]